MGNEIRNKKKIIQDIKENYQSIERKLVEELYMKHSLHPSTTGYAREDTWKDLFELILPKKFVLEQSVFIVDAGDGMSREVDLAVIDQSYTPYIFQYGRIKFVPIEAVAIVIECKSTQVNTAVLIEWVREIEALRISDNIKIARTFSGMSMTANQTQKSTRPIRILCSLDESAEKKVGSMFDITILAKQTDTGASKLAVNMNSKYKNLFEWFVELNFYKVAEDEKNVIKESLKCNGEDLENITLHGFEVKNNDNSLNTLLTFNLQLNQLTMLINNPPLYSHIGYANMFNGNQGKKNE